jgi:hypothetical protein
VLGDSGTGQTFLQPGTDPVGAPTNDIKGLITSLLGGGGQLTTDLTNFNNLVSSLTKGTNAPSGFGSQTTPESVGIGAAGQQLDDKGKSLLNNVLPKDHNQG